MNNKYLRKGLAAFAVIVLALTPAFGAVCAMPCGSGEGGAGGSCCCRPSETAAAEVLSSPTCCASEVKAFDPGILARAAAGARALESPTASVGTIEEISAVADLRWPTPRFNSPGNARSSPLFLLHASFVI
jgi:hypothetical protein